MDEGMRYLVLAEALGDPLDHFQVFVPDLDIARETARAVSDRHRDMRVSLRGPNGEPLGLAGGAEDAFA